MAQNKKEAELLEEARVLTVQINSNLPDKIEAAALSHISKLPFKAVSLRETLIHRIADLSDAAISLYKSSKIVPTIIMIRSVFETSAVLFWLFKKLKHISETNELDDINDFLNKHLFGGKDDDATVKSYNILTAIDHTDKEFENYRIAYDDLSEFAHPNWSGLIGAYSDAYKNKYVLKLGKGEGKIPYIFSLLLLVGSLKLTIYYYDEMERYFMKFNKLCDRRYCKDTAQKITGESAEKP